MATYGQLITFGPIFDGGSQVTTLHVYHYVAGTTILKDVYTDRSKTTTAAQPVVSDSNGIVSFYADGLFKFVVKDGSDSTTLYTYDNWNVADNSGALSGEGAALTAASTLTLGTDGNQFHVTGSTGITALSGTQPEVTLIFDSTPTLTHSGSLILANATDYTAVAGDVIVFMNEGAGIWREVIRRSTSAQLITLEDSRTATTVAASTLRATTSGIPAAGIGTSQKFQAESQDENPSDVGQHEFAFSDVGTGTEDSYYQVLLRVAGAALTSCYRFVATGAFNAIFTHANTAARTYTLPDNTQKLAGMTTILASGSLPAANNVDITNIPQTYAALVLRIEAASSDTATRIVYVRTSVDNGLTFTTAGVYGNVIQNGSAAAIANASYVVIGGTQTAAQTTYLTVTLTGYQAGNRPIIKWAGRYADSLPVNGSTQDDNTNGGINALRIIWDGSGNFDGGTYALFGVN